MNGQADMIGTLRARLTRGRRDFLTPADIAAALDVSCLTVYGWIQAGDVEALDAGTHGRPAFKVFMPSLLSFLEQRSTRRNRP